MLLGLRCLGLLLGDLELRGIEVHELGLDILLGGLGLGLDRCLLLLLLRLLDLLSRSGSRLSCLLLQLVNVESRWVSADVVDERREGGVTEEGLQEAAVTLVLSQNALVVAAEAVGFLGLEGDFAFELANVFCNSLVILPHKKVITREHTLSS